MKGGKLYANDVKFGKKIHKYKTIKILKDKSRIDKIFRNMKYHKFTKH